MLQPRVIRETEKLPDPVRREAQDLPLELAIDPYPPESLRLRKSRNSQRLRFYWGRHPNRNNRVALYRLICEVFEATRTISILRIACRDEVTYSTIVVPLVWYPRLLAPVRKSGKTGKSAQQTTVSTGRTSTRI